jgi:hypothetical protein
MPCRYGVGQAFDGGRPNHVPGISHHGGNHLGDRHAARRPFDDMSEPASKRPRGKRRELAPLEPIDANDGPAMKLLPSDRHRAFVRALY